jgi:hypothetical protein
MEVEIMSKYSGQALVDFCKTKLGVPYVYGMKGEVMTLAKYNELKKLYGSYVWDSDKSKVGKICYDCSGLISWYTGVQMGSSQYKAKAKECHPISTIDDAPVGALVWQQGHIGVYIGMENGVPMYIAEDGSAYGCHKNKIANAKFTHWLLMSDFDYKEVSKVEVKTYDEAVKVLIAKGVITSREYWDNAVKCVKYLDALMINAANKLG